MNETLILLLSGIAGGLLGAMYFGSLWWTVCKGVSSSRPAVWFFAGMLLRIGTALAGFHFVAGGRWERLPACLVGFVLARLIVTWLIRLPVEKLSFRTQEAGHAAQPR